LPTPNEEYKSRQPRESSDNRPIDLLGKLNSSTILTHALLKSNYPL